MNANEFPAWVKSFLTGRDAGLAPVDVRLIRDAAAETLAEIANGGLPDVPPPTDD